MRRRDSVRALDLSPQMGVHDCRKYLYWAPNTDDRLLSDTVVHLYDNISKFVYKSVWNEGISHNGKRYISCTYRYHQIRIYGAEHTYSFQFLLKEKGVRWHTYGRVISAKGKNIFTVKELAYTALRGTLSKSEAEKEVLRNLYRELKSYT